MYDSNLSVVTESADSTAARWSRLTDRELIWCLRFHQAVQQRWAVRLFAIVSRLGDGVFWYGLMAALLLIEGAAAIPVVSRMLLAGAVCLVLYKWLKAKTIRPRPCARHQRISPRVAPLDEYSFPSGHTLHATAFTLIALYFYPLLAWLLLPFATLVALSRIVLGLHYPSDVLAGALLGAGLAALALQ
ncbi:MAG: phosphatase PAP2 family protein [Candidatus Contendobacter sp.]|jgi:undecaprenyl-diphosphatase|nr:phosphatase PAP2 family protein [Gammaproteobacteria bacterium]MCC8994278.1 phosphatase PAP2 family protein [Candidatus Contendobacter sp.]